MCNSTIKGLKIAAQARRDEIKKYHARSPIYFRWILLELAFVENKTLTVLLL